MDNEELRQKIEELKRRLGYFEGHVLQRNSEIFFRLEEELHELEREWHHRHHHHRLVSIEIMFRRHHHHHEGEDSMSLISGPVTLTTFGQVVVAQVVGFDQNGNPWTGPIPTPSWSIDNTSIASIAADATNPAN